MTENEISTPPPRRKRFIGKIRAEALRKKAAAIADEQGNGIEDGVALNPGLTYITANHSDSFTK